MMFEDLLKEYERLEPPGTDAWNPLHNDVEFWHRVRLFIALGWALRQIPISIQKLKVLDVGCGVGRSTRTLLEFGVMPENILGIDFICHKAACAGLAAAARIDHSEKHRSPKHAATARISRHGREGISYPLLRKSK